VLNKAGHPDAVVSVVAAIVGLRFFGLIPAFRSWGFAAVGGAMVVVGVLSLLLPAAAAAGGGASPRSALVGIGCAFALWGGVLPPLVSTWRRAGTRSD
jgi:zinc transporter ZupT